MLRHRGSLIGPPGGLPGVQRAGARGDFNAPSRADAWRKTAPLVTRIIPVNNARAQDLAPLVKDVLSERGTVTFDGDVYLVDPGVAGAPTHEVDLAVVICQPEPPVLCIPSPPVACLGRLGWPVRSPGSQSIPVASGR